MEEKRKHKRVYFTFDESFSLELEHVQRFKGGLLSLSVGGLSFYASSDKVETISQNDIIFLYSLKGENGIELVSSPVSLSVRYIVRDKDTGKSILGCQFLDLDEEDKKRVESFVNKKLESFDI